MTEFSYRTRKRDIEKLSGERVSCLIIGGGIVGAGLANLLSQNGIKTVLVEKGDFASGTSSGSSKLIHGGIRYLAQGHVKLTLDLLRERNYLMRNTDIVRRLDFDILVDRYSWSAAYTRLGLFLYSILGGRPSIPRLRRNNGEYPEEVKGYFPYFDGMTDDSRLVLYNIISAHDRGAICLNYVEAKALSDRGDSVDVVLRDVVGKMEFGVRADVVLNCAGPWINHVLQLYRQEASVPVKLSKGVHLIFDKKKITANRGITFRSHVDRRQMFVIPRDSVCIVGTTDDIVSSPNALEITSKEVEYITESVKRLFPSISENDVLGGYSGIRPLFGKGSDPDRISRNFSVYTHGRMISVGGVKLTDFRNASRKVGKKVGEIVGKRVETRNLPSLSYSRPRVDDQYDYEINCECAIYPDDILRRREGVSIYNPLQLESSRKGVEAAFKNQEGMGRDE